MSGSNQDYQVVLNSTPEATSDPDLTISGTATGAAGQTATIGDAGNQNVTLATTTVGQNGGFSANVVLPAANYGTSTLYVTVGTGSASRQILFLTPITATETTDTVTATTVNSFLPSAVTVAPFTGVAISDPNTLATGPLTATVSVSGSLTSVGLIEPNGTQASGSSFTIQAPNAAALATDLDEVRLALPLGGTVGNYTDTVSAAITDSSGVSTTLSTTANLSVTLPPATHFIGSIDITSAAQTSAVANQTITGTASLLGFAADGAQVSTAPDANATITILDNGNSIGTATTDAHGNFSANVTLPSLGVNAISASSTSNRVSGSGSNTVTDTLQAQAITASETANTVSASTFAGYNPTGVTVAVFTGVAVSDPNPAQLESVTVALSSSAGGGLIEPNGEAITGSSFTLTGLTTAQVAADLDDVRLHFVGGNAGSSSDTVTATITDTAGQSAALASTVDLTITPLPLEELVSVQISSPAETSANPVQTITGTANDSLVNTAGAPQSGGGPLAGNAITLTDNGAVIGTATTNSAGNFSATVTLPTIGANSIVATDTTPLQYPQVPGTFGPTSQPVVDTLLPPTVTLGSGVDTLALSVSERAEPVGAQFTIDVDGQQIGGVQTTAAASTAGLTQTFDVAGDFPSGSNTVSIDYLNADNSLLLVNSATLDGTAVPNSNLVLSNTGTAAFSFAGAPEPSTTTIGTGPDELALFLSERAAPAGAQFTVDVDGQQIGGVQTTQADVLSGQAQQFDVLGNFPTGADTVSIDDLNAANSLLFVDQAYLNDTAVGGSSLVLSNTGTDSFDITGPSPGVPTSITRVGSGPDTLALDLSQRAEPAGAQFTVDVNGVQYGGVQTVTADSTAGNVQELDVLGNFVPANSAPNTVTVNYLNAADSLLEVNSATINGTTIAGGSEVLSNTGSMGFSFSPPPVPGTMGVGTQNFGAGQSLTSGPDVIVFHAAQDYFQGNAQFTISVDGTQFGGVQTVSAIHGNGQSQFFSVFGTFSGTNTVSIDFLNPASTGAGTAGLARNLYVSNAAIDGNAIANSALTFTTAGTQSFSFTH